MKYHPKSAHERTRTSQRWKKKRQRKTHQLAKYPSSIPTAAHPQCNTLPTDRAPVLVEFEVVEFDPDKSDRVPDECRIEVPGGADPTQQQDKSASGQKDLTRKSLTIMVTTIVHAERDSPVLREVAGDPDHVREPLPGLEKYRRAANPYQRAGNFQVESCDSLSQTEAVVANESSTSEQGADNGSALTSSTPHNLPVSKDPEKASVQQNELPQGLGGDGDGTGDTLDDTLKEGMDVKLDKTTASARRRQNSVQVSCTVSVMELEVIGFSAEVSVSTQKESRAESPKKVDPTRQKDGSAHNQEK